MTQMDDLLTGVISGLISGFIVILLILGPFAEGRK
jgi:hypothetical protein